MAFSEQEKKIVLFGKANGKTKEQVKEAILKYRSGYRPPKKEVEPVETEIDTSGQPSQLMEATGIPTVKRIGEGLKERVENVKESFARQESFPGAGDGQTALETGLQTAGQVVGAATDVAAGVAGGVFRTALSPQTRAKILGNPTIQEGLQLAGEGMEVYEAWKAKNPRLAGDLEAVVNIGSIIPVGKGAQLGVRGVKGAVRAGEAVVEGGAKLARTGLETAEKAVQAGKGAIETVGDIASMTKEGVTEIARRVPINIGAKRVARQAVTELPTETARVAVRSGVDINDVKQFSEIAKTADDDIKEVVRTALKADRKEITPDKVIERVGEPTLRVLDVKKKELADIGKKIGEESSKIGTLTQNELREPINKALSGLGIEVNEKGLLNFKNTKLTASDKKAIRNTIQDYYNRATKWGNGQSKHKLREEIFETLGGKEKALSEITGTAKDALKAIRSGLLRAINSKNPAYGELSTQFAKIKQPIQKMAKLLQEKGDVALDRDLRNLDVGILTRRITSNAGSNAKIRSLLRQLGAEEKALKLQDTYNALKNYLDIAPGTSLKGEIKSELPSSISEFVTKGVKGFAGKSKAVQRDALEKLLQELFGS